MWLEGSTEAANELVGRYFDELRAFLINSVPDQDCADVLQDIFTRVTVAAHQFGQRSSFRTYLYGIARRAIADYYRKKYAAQGIFDPASHSVEDINAVSPSSAAANLQTLRRLNACLRRLPVNDRLMIELFYWHDMQINEIAHIFKKSQVAIRQRLHRARVRLEKMIVGCTQGVEDRGEPNELEEMLHEIGLNLGVITTV